MDNLDFEDLGLGFGRKRPENSNIIEFPMRKGLKE